MKIIRNGKEYELTANELAAANKEFITTFMKSEMLKRYGISNKKLAGKLAEKAHDKYCEGNGENEGECIDWVYDEWFKSTQEE